MVVMVPTQLQIGKLIEVVMVVNIQVVVVVVVIMIRVVLQQ
jgi:hypothetical protein